MSKTCDFYVECAEKKFFPLERSDTRPAWAKLKHHWMHGWSGCFCVTGISVENAIAWANSGMPTPAGMAEFLADFAGVSRCDECGLVRPIALTTRHGERFCEVCE